MKLLILDVDDTLFDWLTMWSESFGAALATLLSATRLSETELLAALRALNRSARTSERGFTHDDAEMLGVNRDTVAALASQFENDSRQRTQLFPDVLGTLAELKRRGVTLVAHTDTPVEVGADRFVQLGLDGIVDALFATAVKGAVLHRRHLNRPQRARLFEVPHPKPDRRAIGQILAEYGRVASECIYVGDSKMKDIAMARAAGVTDIFAAYGCRRTSTSYELLRKVSHWTDDDIAYEKSLLAVEPTHSLEQFSDILRFVPSSP